MPRIAIINNPFEPFNVEKAECHVGMSVLDWLNSRAVNGQWKGFDKPTIIIVNGEAILQAQYATTFLSQEEDIMSVVTLAGYELIIYAVIAIVAIAAAIIFAPQPPNIVNQDIKEANTVYSLDGRGNQNKLGQEVPCGYGLIRNWFDRGAEPYNGYIDNNQYLYLLLCAGHGSNQITDIRVGNTPIANFKDITVEIIQPYGYISLFRDSVITPDEIGALELFGPNEPEYDGPVGPFIINNADEEIDRIEWDIGLPKGLATQNDNGGLNARTIEGYVEYRQIDETGAPVDPPTNVQYIIQVKEYALSISPPVWKVFSKTRIDGVHGQPDGKRTTTQGVVNGTIGRITNYYVNRLTNWVRIEFTKTLKTIDPQRFTIGVDVALGRYETQFDRTNDKGLSIKAFNDLFVDAARGFRPNRAFYGDKTMVAIRALATSNLNSNSAVQFNGLQQRLLETWDGAAWTERVVTRNPVWAACDACRARYGGRLSDVFLDLPALRSLAIVFDTLGITFDYLFAIKGNIWDTLKTIFSVGRAIPMLNGSRITAIRDHLLTLPETIFTPDSIKKGSFQWSMVLRKLNDYSCVEVEYTDEESFKQETMLCLLDGDSSDYPEKYKLIGITNRDRAYQMGLYYRGLRKYRREVVSFNTNLQGHIPSINSLIAVVHDVPRWGQSGLLVRSVGNTLYLNRTHDFDPAKQYVIIVKQRTGFASQPYLIEPAAPTTDTVVATGILVDLSRVDGEEPVIYILGEENYITKYLRVKSLKVVDIDTISVEAVNNDNRIYTGFENAVAPEKGEAEIIGSDELPVVDVLSVLTLVDDLSRVRASWSAAPNATAYLLEYSYDDLVWQQATVTTNTYYVLDILPGTLYLRVAALNFGQGPYTEWEGEVGVAVDPPSDITGLALQSAFNGLAATIQWNSVATASQYIVKVHRQSNDALLSEISVTGLSYSYSTDEAIPDFAGAPERTLRFRVVAENAFGQSVTPALLNVTNPLPGAVGGIAGIVLNETTDLYEIKISWTQLIESDIKSYTVYASPVSGFAPGPSNIVFNSLASFCIFTVPKSGGYTDYYYRVVALDYWGNELTNISAEQSLAL